MLRPPGPRINIPALGVFCMSWCSLTWSVRVAQLAAVAAELARVYTRRNDTRAALIVLSHCLHTNIQYVKTGFPQR